MPTKLKKLRIDEVSLCDRGANQHARIVLFKRDAPEIETPRDAAPLEFNANGRGPAHSALWESFDNHRRQMGPAQGRTAFQTAWAELTDDEKNEIRNEEAQTEAAREAAAAAAEKERQREMTKKMNDSKLEEIIKLAHDVDAGRMGNYADRASWYKAISKAAETQRKPNETRETAFSRYVTADADGKVMFKCYQAAAGTDYVPVAPEAPVAKVNSANEQIRKLADDLMSENPEMTRYAALTKIHAERPELLAAAKAA